MSKLKIPIINYDELLYPTTKSINFLKQTFHEVGFFYLENHPISLALIEDIFVMSREFFSLGIEEKEKVSINNSPHFRGFSNIGAEKTNGISDMKETLDFGTESNPVLRLGSSYSIMQGPNQWPLNPQKMKQVVLQYMENLSIIGNKIMEVVALGLNFPSNYFYHQFNINPYRLLRLLHYPKYMANQENVQGIGEHTDFGCLVILLQDKVGGLQVKSSKGEWVDAKPISNTLLINVGDMLSLWTNNYFKATPHRVKLNGEIGRISIPFFFEPSLDTVVYPLTLEKEIINNDLECLSKKIIYGEHIFEAFKRSFSRVK